MLTHEDGVVTRPTKGLGVRPTPHPGFGHRHDVTGDRRPHAHRPVVVHLERDEVALVHADQPGTPVEGPLEFGLVVHLHERIHAQVGCEGQAIPEEGILEDGGDEQDAIGSHQARITHVAQIDGEILAQHRERTGPTDRHQIIRRPAEMIVVREHGQARGTCRRVGAGQVRGIELGGQVPLRRGAPLHLGDDRQTGRPLERVGEGPHRSRTTCLLRQRPERTAVESGPLTMAGHDDIEVGGHTPLPWSGRTTWNSGAPPNRGINFPPNSLNQSDPMCAS